MAVGLEPDLRARASEAMPCWRRSMCAFVQAKPRSPERLARSVVGVGAAALVAAEPGAVVVVAHDDRDALGPESLEHLVGPRCIPDQIAEDVAAVDASRLDVGENGVERRQVGVDVGEDGDSHGPMVDLQVA